MIEYPPGSRPNVSDLIAEVEYVGGPRNGHRENRRFRPDVIEAEAGEYRRSVQCADDLALRYVWKPGPTAQDPGRSGLTPLPVVLGPIPGLAPGDLPGRSRVQIALLKVNSTIAT
jgi:hypothetical protein